MIISIGERSVDVTQGELLSNVLIDNDIQVHMPCGGKGICKKCRVTIEWEDQQPFEVLACTYRITHPIQVSTIALGRAKIQTSGMTAEYPLQPIVSIEDQKKESSPCGIAIDIGTTTVVCYLVELKSGQIIDCVSEQNAQACFGADVISRIDYSNHHTPSPLTQKIIGQLDNMVRQLALRNDNCEIVIMATVSNTTMMHYLMGLDPRGIAVAPFTPVTLGGVRKRAVDIGISLKQDPPILILPCLSAYVGSDIVSCCVTIKMQESDAVYLVLDIGTNGEIAIGNRERILTASTAAGPCFEGGGIECGVAGISGAVSRVKFERGQISYETIDQAPPVGICGTGIISAVAQLLECGIVDETGFMEENGGEYDKYLEGDKFVICDNVYISAKDIRQVQLAKAAIAAGVEVLMKEYGQEVEKVFLAGGFGSCLSIDDAVAVGLLDRRLKEKVSSIGNAAASGAVAAIVSTHANSAFCEIVSMAQCIELSTSKDFQEQFISQMVF